MARMPDPVAADAVSLAVIHLQEHGWVVKDADRDSVWMSHPEAEGDLELQLSEQS